MTAAPEVRRSETGASVHLRWLEEGTWKTAVFSKRGSESLQLQLIVDDERCFAQWGSEPTPTLDLLPSAVCDSLGDVAVDDA